MKRILFGGLSLGENWRILEGRFVARGSLGEVLGLVCGKKTEKSGHPLFQYQVSGWEQNISFWKDLWYGKEALCLSFACLIWLLIDKHHWGTFGTTVGHSY